MTMSSSSVDGEEEGQRKVNVLTSSSSSPSIDGVCDLRERNYMGLSDCSSVGSSALSPSLEDVNLSLNLKATELRLGLPGSTSPERDHELCLLMSPRRDEKPLFPLFSPKSVGSGSKRGFSDTVDSFVEGTLGSNPEPLSIQESSCVANKAKQNLTNAASNINAAPTPKTQVVGWPPIRSSFRKNSAATITSKKGNEEVERKAAGDRALFVKVSMDGAPYLRKVDLSAYSVYQQLSSALEKMFSCFTIGQYGSHGNEKLSETKLKDLLHGSEYVLTYEDKDGDWMLVGDVPWEMFISTCKRLRIMKGCDAIGLAPRAVCGPKL